MIQPISMIRGTSKDIIITLTDDEGEDYTLSEGEVLRLAVKLRPTDSKSEIIKELTAEDLTEDGYVAEFKPQDTAGLSLGRHFYDVGLQTGDDYIPVIECSPFDIEPNVSTYVGGDD